MVVVTVAGAEVGIAAVTAREKSEIHRATAASLQQRASRNSCTIRFTRPSRIRHICSSARIDRRSNNSLRNNTMAVNSSIMSDSLQEVPGVRTEVDGVGLDSVLEGGARETCSPIFWYHILKFFTEMTLPRYLSIAKKKLVHCTTPFKQKCHRTKANSRQSPTAIDRVCELRRIRPVFFALRQPRRRIGDMSYLPAYL